MLEIKNITFGYMKVGDKIICRFGCGTNTTSGKIYTIKTIDISGLVILDDHGDNCFFNLDYFDHWFYTLKTLRLDKLKKINKKYVRN